MRHPRAIIVLLFALAGCATPGFHPTAKFVVEPAITAPPAARLALSLHIRPFTAARAYDDRMLYKLDGFRLLPREGAAWAELPGQSATIAMFDALRASGRFQDVGVTGHARMPDLVLSGEVRRYEEERAPDGAATAVCELYAELRRGLSGDLVWSQISTAIIPMADATPESLAAAMSQALASTINTLATELAALDIAPGSASGTKGN